jgi:membrane associated rhomboid family serine protease/Flp pilus assembly protein TadD
MDEQPIINATPPPAAPFFQRRYPPMATYVLVFLNVVIYALMEMSGGSKSPSVLLDFGASFGPFIRRGEYWRLVMPMFLHIGLPHLILNTIGLFVLGRILEPLYGYGRFAFLYVASGIGCAFLSMTLSRGVSAGASGAIFGIAGAMLTVGFLHRHTVPRRWRRAFGGGILPLIILNLGMGFAIPGIDNWGHVGGLFVGMIVSGVLPPPSFEAETGPPSGAPSQAIVIIPLAVVALAMGTAVEHYRTTRVLTRLIRESRTLSATGHKEDAIKRAQEAARVAPRDERPHEELGSLYTAQGRLDDALREYEEARRLNPLSSGALRGLARAYLHRGDSAKAVKIFEEILGDDARTAEGQRALGDLYAEEKLYGEAIQSYQESLRLNPDDPVSHNNLAWLLATSEDAQFRDPKRALEHAQKAVALDGWKEASFIDTLAEALFANGKYDEAVRTQTQALKIDPKNAEYQGHMARYRKAAGV